MKKLRLRLMRWRLNKLKNGIIKYEKFIIKVKKFIHDDAIKGTKLKREIIKLENELLSEGFKKEYPEVEQ